MRGLTATICLFALPFGACSGGPAATEPSPAERALMMKPGHWDTVFQIKEIAAPGMAPQVVARTQQAMRQKLQTVSSCLSPEEAKKPGAGFSARVSANAALAISRWQAARSVAR